MKLISSFLCICLLVLVSCGEDQTKKTSWESGDEEEIEIPEDFVADTIAIRNLFDELTFPDTVMYDLLAELGICDTVKDAEFNIHKPPCEPRFYKFFRYKKDMPWREGFALEIRAGVEEFYLRRFILFERIDGKLTKIQGFVANLVEQHTTHTGYYDLMLLFRDEEAGSFVVKYSWDKDRYVYRSVEAIDGYLVKEERKDSISNVVHQRLEENSMFF